MEHLVDIANFLYQEIYDNFGPQGMYRLLHFLSYISALDVTL